MKNITNMNYSKIVSPVGRGWVAYYYNSPSASFSFNIRINESGEVVCLDSMVKRVNADGDWYVSRDKKLDNEITEQEFNEALNKTLEFIKTN